MKLRRPIVVANWKLNGGLSLICTSFASFIGKHFDADIVICPPNVYMGDMMTFIRGSAIKIGSQNVSKFASGAYTGETSAQMLREAGCKICLIGHSERRSIFSEANSDCQIKLKESLDNGLLPILCVGENQEERVNNITQTVIDQQLTECLREIDISDRDLCIAYEPIWAIGTGLSATSEMAQEVHQFIRLKLAEIFGADAANKIRLLYGGSVTKSNAAELLAKNDIDGLLVGGASLNPEHFLEICMIASSLEN